MPQQVVAQQGAELVAGQHPPAARGGRVRQRGRDPVGVRVVGQGQVGPVPGRLGQQQVQGAGSSGFGLGRVGNAPSGSACSGTTDMGANPAWSNSCWTVAKPTPCNGV